MTAQILGALASIIIFVFVFWLLRRGVLREKYAVLWLLLSGRGPVLLALPGRARSGSATPSGVETPANLLFFVTVVLLVLVSVQLSYELSRHEARLRRLAEEVALLDEELRRAEGESCRRLSPCWSWPSTAPTTCRCCSTGCARSSLRASTWPSTVRAPTGTGEAERVQACRDLVATDRLGLRGADPVPGLEPRLRPGGEHGHHLVLRARGARDHPRGRHHPGPELLPVLRRAARPVRGRSAGVRHLRLQLRPPGGAVPPRAGVPLQPGAAHLGLGDVAPVVGAASARHRRLARPAAADAPVGARRAVAARRASTGPAPSSCSPARRSTPGTASWCSRRMVSRPADGDEQREPRREHRVRRDRDAHGGGPARAARSRGDRPADQPRSTSCWMRKADAWTRKHHFRATWRGMLDQADRYVKQRRRRAS